MRLIAALRREAATVCFAFFLGLAGLALYMLLPLPWFLLAVGTAGCAVTWMATKS